MEWHTNRLLDLVVYRLISTCAHRKEEEDGDDKEEEKSIAGSYGVYGLLYLLSLLTGLLFFCKTYIVCNKSLFSRFLSFCYD